MIITGVGAPLEVKVLPNFKPLTTLGIKFVSLADGNYCVVDRGAEADVYEARIEIAGAESVIQTFFSLLQSSRAAGNHTFAMSGFNTGEKVFGADVDYTGTITGTVIKLGKKVQTSHYGFTLEMRIKATSTLAFIGSALLPAELKPLIGYDANADYDVDIRDSYFGDMFYGDRDRDAGKFTAKYAFTDTEMKNMRRHITTKRGSTFTIGAINGVTNPWGNRAASFPLTVRTLKWEDLGMIAWGNAAGSAVRNWGMKMTIGEVV